MFDIERELNFSDTILILLWMLLAIAFMPVYIGVVALNRGIERLFGKKKEKE